VKVLSPVIKIVTLDQGLHLLKVRTCISEMRYVFSSFSITQTKRLAYTEVSGSKSMSKVDELICLELGRALVFLNVTLRAEEVRE